MKNIAIFASGSGSNAEQIIKHFELRKQYGKVKLIATDNPKAFVIERAKKYSIPLYVFSKAELQDGSVLQHLTENNIDFIVLAGFLKMIPEEIVSAFPSRIVNIHPALLPKYGGKGMYGDRVHRAVIKAGEKFSGITIHYVNERYDEGDIVFQARCEVKDDDTVKSLATRVHELEWKYYPEVIENLIKDL
ncbi:phosphoribosylglycinamide formyltransferase [Tenuifilum thalassicum]|uniref:Phosphoribosylglycinamide formyltransferase n=1 Tax=Tenuifilum thalassicum TaxID=2590900 RepID=A0A7D3XIP0_9BACT|nr:phosphoribosylglycinamide formyltransferase [Tenuifilum thalassicum]QKG81097.1 phosphoribosylglycinamide formyltransferase [Tenuifilum thalassicum]